jgi:hypothetical protein
VLGPTPQKAVPTAPSASVSNDSKTNGFTIVPNGGYPDLWIDANRLASSMDVVTESFSSSSCEIEEGSVGGTGARKLLRFDVAIANGGDAPLVVGDPSDPNNPYHSWFFFAPCHQHYHIIGFTDYQLLDLHGNVVAAGHKQAFCLEDVVRYVKLKSNGYLCDDQGVSSGWADLYSKFLSGQWIDITGVPDGDYIIYVKINASNTFNEGANFYTDEANVPVHLPLPTGKKAKG